jgi:uncharacterized membrane protein
MGHIWDSTAGALILWLAVLAVLVAVAGYVIGKIRPGPVQEEPIASYWLTKYRELHAQGVLTDKEFQTIKSVLAKQFQQELKDQEELKDDGEKGSNE